MITPEGTKAGHDYVMGGANAYCPKCSDARTRELNRNVIVLTCDFDDE